MDVYPVNIMNVYPVDITNVYPVDIMNVYPVETNPINVNEVVNDLQNMEDVEYISADKENNNEELISTYTCLLLYIQFTYKLTASIFTAVASEDVPEDIKFDMWEEVDSYFDEYGVRNGFAIIKYRMERNSKGQVHKRTLICEFGGKYKSKKKDEAKLKGTQRNTKTKKLGCPWHINLTFPENATQISVTTFINQHNHSLIPKTQEFATKYRSFSEEVINEISLMTKHGNLTLTAQRNLLKARFPDIHFQDQDLANVIQKYKNMDKINNDASALLTMLMQKKAEDLRWVVDFELDNDNRLTRLLWMSPDQVELWLNLCEPLFKQRWNRLLNDYPMAKDYLLRTLDQKFKSWARAYLYKIFTAGIESTARVEGYNWIIKQQLKAKSTLCELADRIDSRLKEEERWNQFHEYKQSTTTNTTSTSGNTIKTEISQCLFVNAIMIEPNNEELSCEQENPDKASDGFIEDQHDARFITLQTMIEEVGQERVLEIWKVVDIRSEKRQYIHFVIIVNTDIYQSGLDLQEKIIGVYNNEFTDEGILPAQKPITIPTTIPILRKAVYKRNLYGHVWGLARTATLLAVEQEDDEITTLLQDYIRRKSNQEVDESSTASTIAAITESSSPSISTIDERSAINERSIIDNIASITKISNTSHENQINEGDTDAGLNFQNVKNPNKVINKGRPPKRRYMSSVEKSREIPKTRGSYKCRVCNGIGHNAAFHKNTGNK
ncbi:unnamed protein product [Rhizophagus irregularis]|nr:unnamed protein product [Rhizophagus irregularis]